MTSIDTLDTIVTCVEMKDLARPGTYDGYAQSVIFPEAQSMWEVFLEAHPQYMKIEPGEHGVEYAIPTVNFEESLTSEDETRRVVAEIIYSRARRQVEIAHLAVSAYDKWRRDSNNRDMIATDYGAVRPGTDFQGMYAYETWKRANIGSTVLTAVATGSPASAEEDYEDAA